MTWASDHYSLQADAEWTLSLLRGLRGEVAAGRFGGDFHDLVGAIACAAEFTRSPLVRQRCREALAQAEHVRAGFLTGARA